MNTLRKILMMVILTAVVFSAGFLSGCMRMTIKGLAADIGDGARFVEKSLTPAEENRKKAQIEEAARIVLENNRNNLETK